MTADPRAIQLIMALRSQGVSDTRVLSAIERVPREVFVPPSFLEHAYDDKALPIGFGQTISQPSIVGLMSQALEAGERMKVLEVGTGSGYQAAVLAHLCRRVYTVERHRDLLREAEKRFSALRVRNVTAICGDGSKGWAFQAPFDCILVTAAAAELPLALLDQLTVGGRLVVPVGPVDQDQVLMRLTRTEEGYETETLTTVRFVPLVPEASSGAA